MYRYFKILKNKRRLVLIIWAVFILIITLNISCTDEKPDPYLIEKNHIGLLTDSTRVSELQEIFSDESLVNYSNEKFGKTADIDIYDRKGNKLLTLSPSKTSDSTATITNVQIFNENYKTAKDISTSSTFKDINEAYKISKINNLINSVVISVNEINASFTIDKKELPPHLQYDSDAKIDKSQIPDSAKIKYFMIHW